MISSLQQLHSAARRTRNFSIKLRSCLLGERRLFSSAPTGATTRLPPPTAKKKVRGRALRSLCGDWGLVRDLVTS